MNFLGSPGFLPRPKAWVPREARPHPGVLAGAATPTGERGGNSGEIWGKFGSPPAALGPSSRRSVGAQPVPGPFPELKRLGHAGRSCRSKRVSGSERSPVFPTRTPPRVSRGQGAARGGPGPAWCRHLEAPNFPAGTGPTSYPSSLSPYLPPPPPAAGVPSPKETVPPHPPASPGPPRRGGDARPRHSLCCRAEGRTVVGRTVVPGRSGRRGHSPPRGGRRGGQGYPRPSSGPRSPQPRARTGAGGGGGSAPAPCIFPAAAGAGSGRWPGAAAAGRLCPH